MRIYVGNLPYKLRENELRAAFEAYGEVASARIIKDKETRRSRGYGFVDMPNEQEAANAINSLNDTELNGRAIKVSEAKSSPVQSSDKTQGE